MTDGDAGRPTGSVHELCFLTVNGGQILAALRNRGVELLDPQDGAHLRTVGAGQTYYCLAELPGRPGGDSVLLAGGADGRLDAYDPATGERRFTRQFGPGAIRRLLVVGGSADQTVIAILDTGVRQWRQGGEEAVDLAFSSNLEPERLFTGTTYRHHGRTWLVGAFIDGLIATWDLGRPGQPPAVVHAHDGPIWSVISTMDQDQPIVVTGGSDRRIRVWGQDERGGLEERVRFVADGTVRRLSSFHDAQTTMVVSASASGSVALWRLDGPHDRPEVEISWHAGEVWAVACASLPHAVIVASGDMNGQISIKHLSTSLLSSDNARVVFQSNTTVWALAHGWTDAGPYVACAGVDQVVNIIDPTGGRAAIQGHRHSSTIRALIGAGTTTRPYLVSGGADHRVLVWDPRTGELERELALGHEGEVWALAMLTHDDHLYVVSGSADGTVRLVSLTGEGEQAQVLARDCGEVVSVDVVDANDDTLIVVGSAKGLRSISLRSGATHPVSLAPIGAARAVVDAGRTLIVVARQDGRVQLVDPIARATVTTFAQSYGSGQVRALQPVEVAGTTFVVGGCDDGRQLVWHLDGSLVDNPVRLATAGIRAMDVIELDLPGGSLSTLVTAGHDGAVRLSPIATDTPLRTGGSAGPAARPAAVLLPDRPTARDQLAREPLVETLYDTLTSTGTRPPLVVGIYAASGQGKSSVLRQLRARIDPSINHAASPSGDEPPPSHALVNLAGSRGIRKPVRTRLTRVWAWSQLRRAGDPRAPLPYEMRPFEPGAAITISFNPRMYERTDQLWAGLAREILLGITDRLSQPERERLWFDLNLRRTDPAGMRRRIMRGSGPRGLIGVTGLVAALLFLTVAALVTLGSGPVDLPELAAPISLAVLGLGIAALLIGSSFRTVGGWSSPAVGVATGEGAQPDALSSTDRGYLYLLQHDVGEVVRLATYHAPLYVFVDDIDQCGPDIVAETVEAVDLFLNQAFGPCVFVLALDPSTVAYQLQAGFVEPRYEFGSDDGSFDHLRRSGWRFMEKIVDLPVRLPRIPDTALSNYVDGLLDIDAYAYARAFLPEPPVRHAGPSPADDWSTDSRPRDGSSEAPPAGPSTAAAVELVIVPDAVGASASMRAVDELERLPAVRDGLRSAVLSLPDRDPRQTKAFLNMWRFYMVLDHRMGLFSPSLLAIERHSIEVARVVELMLRWPYLLGPLREPAVDETIPPTLDLLLDACFGAEEEPWATVARQSRLNPDDRAVQGLRQLLRQALPHRDVFASIARRYL